MGRPEDNTKHRVCAIITTTKNSAAIIVTKSKRASKAMMVS